MTDEYSAGTRANVVADPYLVRVRRQQGKRDMQIAFTYAEALELHDALADALAEASRRGWPVR